jgi:iron complex outermembrane receptor protein
MHRTVFIHAIAACLFLAGTGLPAQSTTSFTGTVTDGSGGAISGAHVKLAEQNSGAQQTALADAAGICSFASVPAGTYTVSVNFPGFTPYEKKDFPISGQTASLAVTMQPSANSSSVEVSAKIDPFQVVPDTPTASVFGLDAPLDEIPRSISVVPGEMITRYDIKTVNDLVAATPGSFTGSYFGVPGALFVRGEAADNFYRGFRRVENRGNYQTPIGDAEELEVVKGPPSPNYGGGRVGGFMNYTPKSARSTTAKWLEHPTGKLSFTYGSYDQKQGSAEFGSPFKVGGRRGGFYTFLSMEDSKSYYKGISARAKTGQIAFDMELPGKWRVETGMQGFAGALPQNIGWNRVTQQLVDNGTYLAGSPAVNLAGKDYNLNPTNFAPATLLNFAFAANYAPIFLASSQAALYALDPRTIHLTHLNNDQIFIDSPDFSDAITFTGYFDLIRDFREGVRFKNQTFYDSLNHQKYSTYGFAANYHPHSTENKSSLEYGFRAGKWLRAQTITGFSYRHTEVSAGEERTLEQVIDRRDISLGATPNDRFASVFSTKGVWGYNYYQQGTYGDTGLFALSSFTLFNKLTILQGIRYDHYTPDFKGQDNGEGLTHASDTGNATTFNTSVSYRLPMKLIPYFTYATSRYLDLGQGGELDYSQIQNRTWVQPSNMYEGGLKTSAFENKLFASVGIYKQKHNSFNPQSGTIDYFRTKGVEAELRAAISRKISVTGAYTWQKPEQLNIPFLLGIPPSVLGLTPQQAYGGRFIGDAGIFGIKAPVKVAGQPPVVVSAFATYSPRRDFGVTMGTTWVQKVQAGYVTPVMLPSYMTWRGSVFYSHDRYTVNLAANNFTNSNYFTSQYLFWDVFIKPSAMRTLSLTVSYRF